MRGVCIDTGATTVLVKDQKYFLFEHGPNNFLVSKFDNPGAHCGSYQRKQFLLIENLPEPPEHPNADAEQYEELVEEYKKYNIDVDEAYKQQRYIAEVKRYKHGYRVGDRYIVTDKGPNGYFHVYLIDRPNKAPIGSYNTEFMEIIGQYDENKKVLPFKRTERPKLEDKPPPAPIPLKEATTPKIESEQKPKQAKKKKGDIPAGQMNIFDFLEG